MCYTGVCRYERIDGDCSIAGHKNIVETTGFTPCFLAGMFFNSMDDEKLYRELANSGKLVT